MAPTFSCTLAFRSSYFLNTRLNVPVALKMMNDSAAARITMATTKIMLRLAWMENAMMSAVMSMTGARTQMRVII